MSGGSAHARGPDAERFAFVYNEDVIRQALAVSLALGLARGPSCGEVDSPPSSFNAPCTRDHDCRAGLACVHGVCAPPAETSDAEPGPTLPPEDAGDG